MSATNRAPEAVRLAEADADYTAARENYAAVRNRHRVEAAASSRRMEEARGRWEAARHALEASTRGDAPGGDAPGSGDVGP